jgi:CRP-like cAMP-binding protein
MNTIWYAALIGLVTAISYPIGSSIGLGLKPGPRVTSAMLAFGAGTLIFALAVEIVAGSVTKGGFFSVGSGMILGGLGFEVVNHLLNQRGAFLRKVSVAAQYIAVERKRREHALLKRLAHVHLLQSLPPQDITPLVRASRLVDLRAGEELFREGEAGSSLYLIDKGELEVIRGGQRVAILTPGETVGEMAVVTGAPRSATIRALRDSSLFYIPKPAFDDLVQSAARVRDRVSDLIKLRTEELKAHLLVSHAEADDWLATASDRLGEDDLGGTTPEEIQEAAGEQRHAWLGIWMGNLLDSIPEAIALGATVTAVGVVSWPLLAGIFLDNMPAAMSSAGIMRTAGMPRRRIQVMWWSIVIVSGVFSALGNWLLLGASPTAIGFVSGTAAGAMLVMIAETILPEAYERGGAIVGLATLAGFLAALTVKSFT